MIRHAQFIWICQPQIQVLGVALPEEMFFRGYILGRLRSAFVPRRRLLGVPFGVAHVLSALLFAVLALLNRRSASGDPLRLAGLQNAAAALWLVAPCTQLFQDQRPDDSVDLAIGTEFNELAHSDDIEAMLASLKPDATQPADTSLLPKIHNGAC